MNHVGRNFRTHLSNNNVEHELRRLMDNLASSAKYVSAKLRGSEKGLAGSTNVYGEKQTKLDILADQIILERLSYETSFNVKELASEEQGNIIQISPDTGRYSVTMDPLDGSSLVDVNLSIGTIIGIHDGGILSGKSAGESLTAAMSIVYGPDTSLIYTAGKGVHEFRLDQVGNWILTRENIQLNNKGNIFAPGGLRKEWTENHRLFIEDLEKEGYKLRYSGALVADINQILLKGGGVFTYPALKEKPEGKLRLLFELQPLSLIIENAGGEATDGVERILNKVPGKLDQRSPIYIGSSDEISLAKNYIS